MTAFATRVVDRILRARFGARGTASVDAAISRQAAARFGRGNTAIQLDAFVTDEAFAKERAEVAAISLPK